MDLLELKKEYPASVIKATINGKELLLIIWPREGKYLGANFTPITLTLAEKQVVCSELAKIRREMKILSREEERCH